MQDINSFHDGSITLQILVKGSLEILGVLITNYASWKIEIFV